MDVHEGSTASETIAGLPPLFDPETNAQMAVRLFAHIDATTTDLAPTTVLVDPAIYSDPQTAALEQERIFDRVPVIVAHVSELSDPYDFITADLPGNRALV